MSSAVPIGFGLPMFDEWGGFRRTEGAARLRELILSILLTRKGERVMRPEFGSDLLNMAFQPGSTALQDEARVIIRDALARWEPRVEVLDVLVEPASMGVLSITLKYRVSVTDEIDEIRIPLET